MKKFIGTMTALAFAVTGVASAQTTNSELEAQIAVLMAEIAALSGTPATTVAAPASCNFTQTLTLESTGAEVVELQSFLEMKGTLTIPAGVSKGYFGGLTQGALASYQAMVGISPAVGFFGPVTRANVNGSCAVAVAPAPAPAPGTPDAGTPDATFGSNDGSEASLEDYDFNTGDDNDVEEGGKAEIAEIEFDVEDGDVRLERLDLTFVFVNVDGDAATGENEPWDTFETITLMVDGDEIASEDVSDEDDWLDEDTPFSFRFSGIDHVFEKDETATIVIEVEAASSVDDADTAGVNDWRISVENDDLRALDESGIDQYVGDGSFVQFGIDNEGQDDELDVQSSSDDPDSATLKVEDNKTSDDYTVFEFEIEADEDSSDLDIDNVSVVVDVVGLTSTGAGADTFFGTGDDVTTASFFNDIVRDYTLVINGEKFSRLSDNNGGGAGDYTDGVGVTLTFDVDEEFTLEAGETADVKLELEFKSANATNYNAGATVRASIIAGGITAEGADDLVSEGTATGEIHTLEVSGLIENYTEKTHAPATLGDDTIAIFTFEFDLEAFEDTFYIAEDGTDFGVTSTGTVLSTSITDGGGATLTADNSYRINQGDSETFTVEVQVASSAAAGTPQSVQAILNDVDYNVDSNLGGATAVLLLGAPDYKSATVSVIDAV